MGRMCQARHRVARLAFCWLLAGFAAAQVPATENFLHLDNAIVTTVSRDVQIPSVARVDPFRNDGCLYILGTNFVDKVCNYAATWPASPGSAVRVAGSTAFGRRDGPLTTALFSTIFDMDFYDAGQLILTGEAHNLVHLVDLNSGVVSEFAGKGFNYATRDGVGTNAAFQNPQAVATNKAGGVVYIGGVSNIRKVVWSTREVSKLSGHNGLSRGRVDGNKDVSRFNRIRGLTYHDNYLYATDSANQRIRRIHATTGATTSFVGYVGEGWQDGGPGVGKFSWPSGIVADSRSTPPVLYVVTPNHNRIRVVDINTRYTWTVAGWNRLNLDGIGTFASFANPKGISVDYHSSNPRIFVADYNNCQIRMITRRTPNTRKLVRKSTCSSSNPCGLCEAKCNNDNDCSGSLRCFHRNNFEPVPGCPNAGTHGDQRSADFCTDASGALTMHPTPAVTQPPGISPLMGDRSNLQVTTVATSIDLPRFMHCDWSVGDCVVSSSLKYKVHRVKGGFDVSPLVIETAGSGTRGTRDGGFAVARFDRPGRAILFGTISYHPDMWGQHIRKIDWQAKVVDSATRHIGGGYVDGPFNVAKFRSPESTAKRSATSMFVGSTARIQMVDIAAGVVTSVVGDSGAGIPTNLRIGNRDGPCTTARMNQPYLTYDKVNNTLYYASYQNYLIRAVDLGAAQCTTRIVLGRREFAGNHDGPSSLASFTSISSIRYQMEPSRGTQYIFFTGVHEDRIRAWDMNADYVLHAAGWNNQNKDGWHTNARFSDPTDIVLRETDRSPYSFYIVDTRNNKIRLLSQLATTSPTLAPTATFSPTVVHGNIEKPKMQLEECLKHPYRPARDDSCPND